MILYPSFTFALPLPSSLSLSRSHTDTHQGSREGERPVNSKYMNSKSKQLAVLILCAHKYSCNRARHTSIDTYVHVDKKILKIS